MRLKEVITVLLLDVIRLMGRLKRSENSLNQHIKLKHREFWDKTQIQLNTNEEKKIYTKMTVKSIIIILMKRGRKTLDLGRMNSDLSISCLCNRVIINFVRQGLNEFL